MAIPFTTKSSAMLENLSQPQRDRLAFIDLRLRMLGELKRQHLIERFEIQEAAASRDIALYKTLSTHNLVYDASSRLYKASESFESLFDPTAEHALIWVTKGLGDGEPRDTTPGITVDFPDQLTWPKLDILGHVTQAIHQKCPLQIDYESLNGASQRVIVPFSLVDNGLRWHVRGFDRKSGEFRDFVITRIRKAIPLPDDAVAVHETSDQDIQWTRIVELTLIPHPDQPRPEVTLMDYAMVDGMLSLKLRAATAGYTLRKWSVDCSPDHSLRGPEFRLWLSDPLALYGVKNAILAPGYVAPDAR